MGEIVGGFGTSHVLFPPKGVEMQAKRVMQGMMKLRAQVRALKPDVIVLAAADHLNNFNLAMQVTLAVGVRDEYKTLGDAGVPAVTFPGHRDFAETFASFASERDFELVQVEELRPDHGMALPHLIADPDNVIPIVPVYINSNMPAPPKPSRCYQLGGVLKDMVETLRPEGERVVVVGCGGLSHWLCMEGEGNVAAQFDEDCIARIVNGRAHEVAALSNAEILKRAGNGGLEISSWLFMAGALPGGRGDKLYYEAIPEWISGMGGVALYPAGSAA